MSDQEAKAPVIHSWSVTPSNVVRFTHVWTIENFSFYQNDKIIVSPEFTTRLNGEARWCIHLYPNGDCIENKYYISLFLELLSCESGRVSTKYGFSILDAERDVVEGRHCGLPRRFKPGEAYGFEKFIPRHMILNKPDCLPGDNLTVMCEIFALSEPSNAPDRSPGDHIPVPRNSPSTDSDWRRNFYVEPNAGTFHARQSIPRILPRSSKIARPCGIDRTMDPMRERTFHEREASENAENLRLENRPSPFHCDGKGSTGNTERVIDALKQQNIAQLAVLRRIIDQGIVSPSVELTFPREDSSSATTSISPKSLAEEIREVGDQLTAPAAAVSRRNSAGAARTANPTSSSSASQAQISEDREPRTERDRSDRSPRGPLNIKIRNRENPLGRYATEDFPTIHERHAPGRIGFRPEPREYRADVAQEHFRELARNAERHGSLNCGLRILEAARASRDAPLRESSSGNPSRRSTREDSTANPDCSRLGHSSNVNRNRPGASSSRQAFAEKGDSLNSQVRNVAVFNGDPAFFRVWWLDFKLKVHDRLDLSPSQKFACLRASLVGDAKKAIRLTFSPEADYIDTLQNLYNMFGGEDTPSPKSN